MMTARILVIEDNPTNLELVETILKGFGHTALLAKDGPAGLELARRERPDVILIDILMPKMNGDEVAQELKADPDPAVRGIPLIAVTALAMVGDRDKALASGFDGYVSKPLTPVRLMETIDTFLPAELRALPRRHGE